MGSSFLLSSHIQGLPCSRMIDNVTLVPPENPVSESNLRLSPLLPVVLSGSLENSKRLMQSMNYSSMKNIIPAPMTEIIQCRMCHLQFPGEKCSRGRGFCIATENECEDSLLRQPALEIPPLLLSSPPHPQEVFPTVPPLLFFWETLTLQHLQFFTLE
eukprot:XP_022273833.1 prostate and testis expressed protein 1 isoform X9 [Canis lupus familiaris]